MLGFWHVSPGPVAPEAWKNGISPGWLLGRSSASLSQECPHSNIALDLHYSLPQCKFPRARGPRKKKDPRQEFRRCKTGGPQRSFPSMCKRQNCPHLDLQKGWPYPWPGQEAHKEPTQPHSVVDGNRVAVITRNNGQETPAGCRCREDLLHFPSGRILPGLHTVLLTLHVLILCHPLENRTKTIPVVRGGWHLEGLWHSIISLMLWKADKFWQLLYSEKSPQQLYLPDTPSGWLSENRDLAHSPRKKRKDQRSKHCSHSPKQVTGLGTPEERDHITNSGMWECRLRLWGQGLAAFSATSPASSRWYALNENLQGQYTNGRKVLKNN